MKSIFRLSSFNLYKTIYFLFFVLFFSFQHSFVIYLVTNRERDGSWSKFNPIYLSANVHFDIDVYLDQTIN